VLGQSYVNVYNPERGYGFIVTPDEQRYFFHITDVADGSRIEVDRLVSFEPGTSPRGLRARRVSVWGKFAPLREESGKVNPALFLKAVPFGARISMWVWVQLACRVVVNNYSEAVNISSR
jgi:cold shock CspA family protein